MMRTGWAPLTGCSGEGRAHTRLGVHFVVPGGRDSAVVPPGGVVRVAPVVRRPPHQIRATASITVTITARPTRSRITPPAIIARSGIRPVP